MQRQGDTLQMYGLDEIFDPKFATDRVGDLLEECWRVGHQVMRGGERIIQEEGEGTSFLPAWAQQQLSFLSLDPVLPRYKHTYPGL